MECVAFYLPQYHVIPENEAVYGPGFTEWANVLAARPLFDGHQQPEVPHQDFGYYNLLDENFLVFQHQVAREHGIGAFCYYYYNLAGKPLLEKPLRLINQNKLIKNRFCLCWDHASWHNNQVATRPAFLKQEYSLKNAALIFSDLLQYFGNERYLRVKGKPLFCVWAPERHPLLKEYVSLWRGLATKNGLRGLWLAGVQAYQGSAPQEFGLDGAVEFAPSWSRESCLTAADARPRLMDYAATASAMLARPVPPYLRLRCLFPAWDNTPRRGAHGIATVNLSLDIYKIWLSALVAYTRSYLPSDLQYIFINGWNEWGEGCHLEPDARLGYAYLQATREVMRTQAKS